MTRSIKHIFQKLIMKSSNDIFDFMKNVKWSTDTHVFRGQSDCSWSISSGLERRFQKSISDPDYLFKAYRYEKNIVKKFQTIAHHYVQGPMPENDDYLEWLSIIQHYGGKTRLVDFSRSILVALYFAVKHENKEQNSAIWAVNTWRLWNYRRRYYENDLENYGEWAENNGGWTKEIIKKSILFPPNAQELIMAKPFRINQRLQSQQGEFLFPISLRGGFMANLAETMAHSHFEPDMFDDEGKSLYCDFSSLDLPIPISHFTSEKKYFDCGVIKIEIPSNLHEELRRVLKNLNVTAAILFPDLEGTIRDLDHEED